MDGGAEITTVPHRFSVQDYHRLGQAGVLDQMRVELIRGIVLDRAPIGTPHVSTVMQLTELLAPLLVNQRARLSVQSSLRMGEQSEPEPDVVLLRWESDRAAHPSAPDVLLVIEVADSSLALDREVKGPMYASAGIAEYWLVNLLDQVVEVHRDPGPDGYRQITTVSAGHLAPLALPDFEIAVAEILPPVRA